jgi:hypothetical protein
MVRKISSYYRGKSCEVTYYLSLAKRPLAKNKTSKYKGVHYLKPRDLYCARLNFKGRRYYLGTFKTEKEAAIAWNTAALDIIGSHVPLNVIE